MPSRLTLWPAQEDIYTSAERATTKTSEYVETSTSTANLFANESVSAFAMNDTNLVSTDLAIMAGRDVNARVGRSTSFVTKHMRIASEMGVDLDAGNKFAIGTATFALAAYTEMLATTTKFSLRANRSAEIDSVGSVRVGAATLAVSSNTDAVIAVGQNLTSMVGGDAFLSTGGGLDVAAAGVATVVGDSL
eukprot:COSAG01_NODE_10311_length_2195_cov_1.301527_1_plen_190_part_10